MDIQRARLLTLPSLAAVSNQVAVHYGSFFSRFFSMAALLSFSLSD
jgi:hypothetical protein